MDDKNLIDNLISGDQKAFKSLVDLYADRVFRVCYSFVNHRQNAEDLSQEVFIEAFRSMVQFKRESQIGTWLYRIAINKSLNFIRKKKQTQWLVNFGLLSNLDEDKTIASNSIPELSAESQFINQEQKKLLYETIEKLPKNQRIAFTLHKLDDMSYKEISEIMDVSLPSVESLLHRAKKGLQEKLLKNFR